MGIRMGRYGERSRAAAVMVRMGLVLGLVAAVALGFAAHKNSQDGKPAPDRQRQVKVEIYAVSAGKEIKGREVELFWTEDGKTGAAIPGHTPVTMLRSYTHAGHTILIRAHMAGDVRGITLGCSIYVDQGPSQPRQTSWPARGVAGQSGGEVICQPVTL